MNGTVVPLALPKELHTKIKAAARELNRTQASIMRDSMGYGLPRLVEAHRFALGKPAQPTARK